MRINFFIKLFILTVCEMRKNWSAGILGKCLTLCLPIGTNGPTLAD